MDQLGNVLGALAQGRNANRHNIQPEIQILAKQAMRNQLAQIPVGRSDDAHIGANRAASTNRGKFAFLQHPQKPGLRFQRHVADFVQEQGAAIGLLETARRAGSGPCKGALLMPEQLALDQFARNRRHIDRDKRTVAALAVIMQGARYQFLAGPRLAAYQHRQVGRHQARQNPVNFLHRLGAPDQRQPFVVPGAGQGLVARLFPRRRFRKRPLNYPDQLLEIKWFRDILEGASFSRLNGGQQGILGAHHDDAKFRPQLADAGHQVQPVLVGHHHIGDDHIAFPVGNPTPQGRRIT